MKRLIVTLVILLSYAVSANAQVQYEIIDLGVFGPIRSTAHDINNSGQIVGNYNISAGITQAFVYDNGTLTNLGTLNGNTESWAYGINDLGQIVGYSGSNSVLWNPVSVVPEPISSILFLTGGATLGLRRFMRKKLA